MPHLSLAFLGGFDVTLDAEPVTAFGADKARALLAFLASEATHPHRRSKLCAMFWPDLPEKKAAHNLSQTLLRLRRALGESGDITRPPLLLATTQTVQFNASSDYELDVARFRALLRNVEEHRHPDAPNCEACHRWLAEAAALYKGDLLAGLLVPDSVAFEEWRLLEQEELHRQAWEVLERLTAYHERRGEFERVQAYARRQLALEPWREEVHLQLMRALALSGQPATALKQFEHYQRTLAEELGLQPSAEARRLYTQIRSGELVQGPTAPADAGEVIWLDSQGERRQVTMLVCSRITQAGSQASLEEFEEQATACRSLCENICHRFGGWRARRQGNTCIIYFGYPQVYEDAARRAVYAALSMTAVSGDYDAARIGIHTGVLVVGQSYGPSWHDRDLLGNVLEIARDCQRLAAPNEVIITEATQRLLHASFDVQALDPVQPSETAQPLSLYRVRGASSAPSRLDWLTQTQRLTKFAGRDEELRQLETGYATVLAGRGQAVLLRGEPGIGKSRLLWELKQRTSSADATASQAHVTVRWLTVRCLPHYQNTSLYPIVGLLEQLLGFQAVDSPDSRREQLTGILAWYGLDQPAALWLLSLLLGLPTPTAAPATLMPAQREQMRKLFVALVQKHATALNERSPLVLVIEDLHWSDPSTVEWLGRSLAALATVPCLVLLTARPEFSTAWLSGPDAPSNLLVLNLKPLRLEAAATIVADVAGEDRLDGDTRRRIINQTDGNPLFIEELTKTLLEQPAEQTPAPQTPNIPVTLLDSLAARLDRLGPAKETAQWAAVLGREFSYPILQACVPYAEGRLQGDLARLLEAELVSAVAPAQNVASKGAAPTLYQFKHALIQEAAYASLLKRTRQTRHQHVAETLITHFPQIGETQPEMLAQHYSNAGLPAAAIDCWLQAGEQATVHGATLEAQTFFDRALAIIEPTDREQRWRALAGREVVFNLRAERNAQQRDIDALLELAETFNDDTRRAQARLRQMHYALLRQNYQLAQSAADAARACAQQADAPVLEVDALAGKTSAFTSVGKLDAAQQTVAEMLARLPRTDDEGIRAYALSCLAIYHHFVGDLSHAVLLWQQAGQAVQRVGNRVREARTALNVGFTFLQLGLYTQARTTLEEDRALAEAIGEQDLSATLLSNLSYAYWCSGDRRQARALAEAALQEFRTTLDSPYAQAGCQSYLGVYLAEAGEWAAAAAHLAEARVTFVSIGTHSSAIEPQAVEATCLLALGRRNEAQQLAAAAWAYLAEHGSTGIDFPTRAYLCVADVFAAQATPEIAPQTVIAAGYRNLMRRAVKISDPVWRRSFLENVAEHKRLVERWQQINAPSAS